MFSRISALFLFIVLAFPFLASATAIVARGDCNTGSQLCCNSAQDAATTAVTQLAGSLLSLGINLGPLTGLVGLTCTPIGILGIGGNSCSAQPVCCSNNSFGGLLALGCSPLNLNL